ncbi:hypothetical protein B0T24DRAFT_587317 [Lasiosphaeria ovina]|uniref:BTB domain-containing protein n=1 Tax=Lasiosphaeria ovina TaxID=92902 RepID=A0AAE0TWW6_9PEZI|nr:hypothetical protein B0T24DRAFT_587317 [Lasiosphaeria ovina]
MASNGHATHGHAVTNIARAGDTVLVVGPDAERMIVSSAVLSGASRETKALVGAGFAGRLPGPINGLVAVRLPHDQPDVVQAVLYALHGRLVLVARAADYHKLDMKACSCGWYVLGAKDGLAGSGLAVSDISSSGLGRCVEAADKVCSDALQQHCYGAHQHPNVGDMVRERLKLLMEREDGSPCPWCVYQGEPHHMYPGESERFKEVTNSLREELGRVAGV